MVQTQFDNKAFEADEEKVHNVPQDVEKDSRSMDDRIVLGLDERVRIYKNVGVLAIGFMLLYSAYQGISNLQSTLNADHGLGTFSLALIFGFLVISSIFLPSYVISKLSIKWAIFCGVACIFPFILVQIYPSFYLFIPAAMLAGLGAAPMWAAVQTYLTQLAQVYSAITKTLMDNVVTRFFGIFFFFWQTCDLWGNLLSSLILGNNDEEEEENPHWDTCGSDFCSAAESNDPERPPDAKVLLLVGVYGVLMVICLAIIAFLLDPLTRYGEQRNGKGNTKELIWATFRQMKKPNQQLLIAATVFMGMEQAFMAADYTAAFVSCTLSINWIGYVMLTFGAASALGCLFFGWLMSYTGRIPIVIFGAMSHLTIFVYSLFWEPHPQDKLSFFIIAAVFGMADSTWQTQINGLYGVLFRRQKEAAFSNYRLWESLGFCLSYMTSTYICMWSKLVFLACFSMIALLGYLICEWQHSRRQRRLTIMSVGSLDDRKMAQEEMKNDDSHDDLAEKIVVVPS